MKHLLTLVAAAALFVGCQSYPMGLNETQWKALTPEQQAEYTRQQTAINEVRRQQREAEERARQVEAEAKAAEERQRVEFAYARARYGDVITVTVEGGLVAIGGKHHPYEPVRFDLVHGERKEVEFVQQGKSSNRNRVDARLSEDGNTLYFDESARDRITLLSTGWDTGKTSGPLSIQDRGSRSVASAITITVKYKPLPGGPRRVIILPAPK
ncbi:MAG: hypothetical protein EB141_09710 [Verrucomicrobia bacterium]|nr:hypothetical protein [Verrucomicrobiota bacterium]NBU09981.1 hypothetical protein [Pseudomonadota bacterium]NDA65093.1 hypothetical protein [Verrucomicrobiota bacterium]NDB75903.1 hypothetical protein [Verrucomicrobiota bacterium]NDD36958.1 hypothetical protein [Verrucomicrobiota bacterium]